MMKKYQRSRWMDGLQKYHTLLENSELKEKNTPKKYFLAAKAERMRLSKINSNVICHRNPQI
jgi:hypothetical protein